TSTGSLGATCARLTAGFFTDLTVTNAIAGSVTGSSGSTTGNAGSATLTNITDDTTTNATMFPTWVTTASGNQAQKVSSTKLTFNPSTGLLTSTGFSGPLTGNVTGNVSGSAATVTGAAQTAITSVGTLTSLTVAGTIAANGGITFDAATDTVGAFTAAGTINLNNNILTNIGNTGTDFIAATGALTLAGVLTANGGISIGTQALTGTTGIIDYSNFDVDASGNVTGTKFNKITITAPATGATLTIADGKTLTASNTLTFTGTDSSSVAFGTGGTVAYTANKLSVFAATTSAELKGVISDETGVSGALVFADSPAFTTQISTPSIITASGALGITPAAGSNVNISLSTTGDFAVNTNQLYVDTSAARVGIGTASPAAVFDIFGTSNALRLTYDVSNYNTMATASDGSMNITSSNTSESQLVIGNATAIDNSVAFDGFTQDYFAGLDDTTGSYMIGTGFVVQAASAYLTVGNTGTVTLSGLATAGIVTNTSGGVLGTTATVPVANGGTNIASYTIGDLIYASGATTLSKLADVATGNCLISGGVGVAPSWGSCSAGNANTALSNLAAVAINTSLLPGANDSINLGDNTHRWADLFLGGETIHIGTSTTDEALVSYTTSTNLLNFSTDSTSNGDIAFFSDDLYLDKSSGFVGVGTTTPGARLSINNTAVPTGGELITNGTFTGSSTGWTLGDCAAYGSNNVTVTYTSCDNPDVSTSFATVAGTTYEVTYTLSGVSGDTAYFYFENNSLQSDNYPVGNGTHTFQFKTDYTGTETITFESWDWYDGGTWTIDDVSIRAVGTTAPSLVVKGVDGSTWLSLGDDLSGNTMIRKSAGASNTTGNFNSIFGTNAGFSNTTGSHNTIFGVNSMFDSTTGSYNVAIGDYTMFHNTSGGSNVAIGASSLYNNTNGIGNTVVGLSSLPNNTIGNFNTVMGVNTLMSNTTGSNNTAVGPHALNSNILGDDNSAFGHNSLIYSVGNSNSALGAKAGSYLADGVTGATPSSSLFLGYDTRAMVAGGTNEIVIGASAIGNGSNSVTLGNTSILTTILQGNVGIGTVTPTSKLDILTTAPTEGVLGSEMISALADRDF